VTDQEELAAEFETQRAYLRAIAFRMLGSHADADDAVQEAWLRLARTGGGGIEDLRGWLTTVTGRICLDVLRRRGVRAEQPLELAIGTVPPEGRPSSCAARARSQAGPRQARARARTRWPTRRSSTASRASSSRWAGGRSWSCPSWSRTALSRRSAR
jgi:DNA-directed RNA polymerase specialized sigma24 family protein